MRSLQHPAASPDHEDKELSGQILSGKVARLLRTKGSHRTYGQKHLPVTVPFHGIAILHPKIIKQVLEIIEEAAQNSASER
jgi:hypothetical protein